MNKKVLKLIDEFSKDPDIKKIVDHIESSAKTTKFNYGRYMQFLTPYAKDPTAMLIISCALIKAGADIAGVEWARRILKGGE